MMQRSWMPNSNLVTGETIMNENVSRLVGRYISMSGAGWTFKTDHSGRLAQSRVNKIWDLVAWAKKDLRRRLSPDFWQRFWVAQPITNCMRASFSPHDFTRLCTHDFSVSCLPFRLIDKTVVSFVSISAVNITIFHSMMIWLWSIYPK
mmetsp:Transcript_51596/g.109731  ORF Transcript_51596/g.109731 Transcript_51596/m.109731 type:complete len:148 (+) Transcript_51596:483-926(+)